MTTTTTGVAATPGATVATKRRVEVAARTAKPVKYWALIGAFFLALQTYVYAAWIVSGEATATPHGPDTPPDWMLGVVRTMEVLAPLGLVVFAYFFLFRPWRRDGHIGLDGLMVLCALGVWWQDPLINFAQPFGAYNSFYFNLGSWTQQVPGWMSPRGSNFAEPLLWTGPAYVWGMFGAVIIANKFMARMKQRWPRMGTLGLILTGFGFFFFFDTLFEAAFMRLGVYTYPGSNPSVSLFAGHYYQFPIYESLLWGAAWTGFACVRFFRNDKGETVAERGIDEVRATPKQKTFIRFLAILGIWNLIFLAYNVSWAFISLNQGSWPKDVTSRSYFTDLICGPGTRYSCPGPKIPVPRPDSQFVDNNGNLASPE